VGKELTARCIHYQSLRRTQPFVVVDCTALQEPLLQSELFGHERGAFTGAIARKPGLFEVAHRGTLLLDEIGELSPLIQVQLLRVLETGQFRRVGGLKDVTVDVRIIAATNRDLRQLVATGQFREDLYFRLNVITLTIPPLRDRPADIPLLVHHFLAQMPLPVQRMKRVAPEVMALLQAYPWPGNIRELKNVVERAVILSDGEIITIRDLPGDLRGERDKVEDDAHVLGGEDRSLQALQQRYAEVEKRHIARLLQEYAGHRAMVAQVLQISERTLYRKLREHHLV
jgi:DNA-binding NtrC family response regulator